ncbi:hypothetical protein VP01_117g1 [Puccinia sorghi]|uniref:Uncharacterized protein n=1 Tax=Puccinia sorghi TaxID=27349 RepID=A0A0L6VR11_9BASI|nr:hypothetical protein VP01_117g1 [Puccinia sorghi]
MDYHRISVCLCFRVRFIFVFSHNTEAPLLAPFVFAIPFFIIDSTPSLIYPKIDGMYHSGRRVVIGWLDVKASLSCTGSIVLPCTTESYNWTGSLDERKAELFFCRRYSVSDEIFRSNSGNSVGVPEMTVSYLCCPGGDRIVFRAHRSEMKFREMSICRYMHVIRLWVGNSPQTSDFFVASHSCRTFPFLEFLTNGSNSPFFWGSWDLSSQICAQVWDTRAVSMALACKCFHITFLNNLLVELRMKLVGTCVDVKLNNQSDLLPKSSCYHPSNMNNEGNVYMLPLLWAWCIPFAHPSFLEIIFEFQETGKDHEENDIWSPFYDLHIFIYLFYDHIENVDKSFASEPPSISQSKFIRTVKKIIHKTPFRINRLNSSSQPQSQKLKKTKKTLPKNANLVANQTFAYFLITAIHDITAISQTHTHTRAWKANQISSANQSFLFPPWNMSHSRCHSPPSLSSNLPRLLIIISKKSSNTAHPMSHAARSGDWAVPPPRTKNSKKNPIKNTKNGSRSTKIPTEAAVKPLFLKISQEIFVEREKMSNMKKLINSCLTINKALRNSGKPLLGSKWQKGLPATWKNTTTNNKSYRPVNKLTRPKKGTWKSLRKSTDLIYKQAILSPKLIQQLHKIYTEISTI